MSASCHRFLKKSNYKGDGGEFALGILFYHLKILKIHTIWPIFYYLSIKSRLLALSLLSTPLPSLQYFNCVGSFLCFFFLVLTDLVTSMHSLREKHNIKFHCPCTNKQNLLNKLPATNGVSQVLFFFFGAKMKEYSQYKFLTNF